RVLTSPFTSIGGTGFTGTPAVVVMPGRRAMVFARHTDGTIKRQYQNSDGTWSGTWTAVGAGGITPAGDPAAYLDPNLGRVLVVTRTTENSVYNAWETGQGTGVWGNWTLNGAEGLYVADPTIFSYQASGGSRLAFVSRTANNTVVPFVTEANALARTSNSAGPAFAAMTVPQPKRN
ncbi:hypothetical protein ABZ814_32080, partial [Micromonospora musae]